MPAAKGNAPLNLSIDERIIKASKRVFAGLPRDKGLNKYVEKQLIKKCLQAGEPLPEEFVTK